MSSFVNVTAEDYQECLNHPSRVVETAVGPVEIAERGEGPAVMSVHGGPGGFDQGLALCEFLRKNGFKVIALSRPGYLGTPLSSGKDLQGQADLLAALVDTLGMGPLPVVGASAGGPPAYALAQTHPDKVSALVSIDGVSMRYTKLDEVSKVTKAIYLSKIGIWLMDFSMRHFPEASVKSLLADSSTLKGHELGDRVKEVVGDPAKLAMVHALVDTMSKDFERRQQGVNRDLESMAAFDKLPLDKISCHTLVVHGSADGDVPPAHGEYAAGAIKGAELLWVDKGSHIGFWISDKAEQAQARTVEWLRKQLPA